MEPTNALLSTLRSLSTYAASLIGALAISGSVAAAAFAAEAPKPAAVAAKPVRLRDLPAETRIPNTRHLEFVSKVNGKPYAIDIGLPLVPAPASGYRVLYVLDGYGYFASAVEAVRGNDNAPDVVVVGIGYPDKPAFIDPVLAARQPLPDSFKAMPPFLAAASLQRMYDLSLPTTDAVLAAQAIPGFPTPKADQFGGIDDFLKTIETEVKPRVATLAPIDPGQQALFGHSLGGLAVLHALFTEPKAFSAFVIASPSIWWADKAVLAKENALSAQVTAGTARPRILVTVGGEEEIVPKVPPGFPGAEKLEELTREARMIGNACDLAGRLKTLHGTAPFEVADCDVFKGQNHGISPWPALGRAVQFAFGR